MAAAVSHPATVRTIGEANTLAGRAAKNHPAEALTAKPVHPP